MPMRNIKKPVKSASVKQRDWQVKLNKMLLNYRVKFHSTKNLTPAELLFGWKIVTKLPEAPERCMHAQQAEIDLKETSNK